MNLRGKHAALRRLRKAFSDGELTLYLGAGCSVASGVPRWDRLVTQLYMNGIARRIRRAPTTPELLPAVAEWAFNRKVVPLEVAARKLRGYYWDENDFLLLLRIMLYGLTGYLDRGRLRPDEARRLLAENRTLRAVSQLCVRSVPSKRGVGAVITYNYDDLLEKALGSYPFQSISSATSVDAGRLPIFHVHGFVPARGDGGSRGDEIVLTEDQYNRAAQEPYSWSNLVQLQALTGSIGLMVGLSITDRNLRMILDAARRIPRRRETFALLPMPASWKVETVDLESIRELMELRIREGYGWRADQKTALEAAQDPEVKNRILRLIRQLQKLDKRQEEATLAELGIEVIWYEEHGEIEQLADQITKTVSSGRKGRAAATAEPRRKPIDQGHPQPTR